MKIKVEYNNSFGVIQLNRPEKAHAYNHAMLCDLQDHFLKMISKTNVIIIQSTGARAFCAGADLNEMKSLDPLSPLDLFSQTVFDQIAKAKAVTIAAIQGPAIAGGFELALACDLRIASPKAYFSFPETNLGLIPSAGGCTRLVNMIGPTRTKGMILGGEKINTQTAMQWGIINRISDTPKEDAIKWAQSIAKSDHLALRLAKLTIDNPSLTMERVAETILYMKKK